MRPAKKTTVAGGRKQTVRFEKESSVEDTLKETGHCSSSERFSLREDRSHRREKTLFNLVMVGKFLNAWNLVKSSVAIKTFHSFNYRQKRRAVNNKRDIFLGTYLEPVRRARRRACPILG